MTTPKTTASPGAGARPASAPSPAPSSGGQKPASGAGSSSAPSPEPSSTGGKQAKSGTDTPPHEPSSYRSSGSDSGRAGVEALGAGRAPAASAKPDIKDPKTRKEFDDKLEQVVHDGDFAKAAASGDEGAASSSLDDVAKRAQDLADEYGVSKRDLIVEMARGEIGVGEDGGDNEGERIKEYRAATSGALNTPGPWCNYFTSFLGRVAGSPNGEDGGGEGAVVNTKAWAEQAGKFIPPDGDPQPGDQVLYAEHIGIVEKVNEDGSLVTIEGNTSDQVMRMERDRSEVVGFVSVDGGGESVLDAEGGPSGSEAPTSSGSSSGSTSTSAPSTGSAPTSSSGGSSAPASSAAPAAAPASSGSSGSGEGGGGSTAGGSSGGGTKLRGAAGAPSPAPAPAPAPVSAPVSVSEPAPAAPISAPLPSATTSLPMPDTTIMDPAAPGAEQTYMVPQTVWTQSGPVQVMVPMTAAQLAQWQATAAQASSPTAAPVLDVTQPVAAPAAPTTPMVTDPTAVASPVAPTADPAAAPVASAAPAPVVPAVVDPSVTPQAVAATYAAPVAA